MKGSSYFGPLLHNHILNISEDMERSRSRSNEKILRDQESFSQPRFRRLFVLSLFGASVFLLISLWLNAAWIYGSLYRQAERAQYLDVVVIDLDGSDIGKYCLSVFGCHEIEGTSDQILSRVSDVTRASHLRGSGIYLCKFRGCYFQTDG